MRRTASTEGPRGCRASNRSGELCKAAADQHRADSEQYYDWTKIAHDRARGGKVGGWPVEYEAWTMYRAWDSMIAWLFRKPQFHRSMDWLTAEFANCNDQDPSFLAHLDEGL